MINSTVEINKLEEEIINLRNENKMLKEQLSQTNSNSATIHNNSSVTDEEAIQRRLQLSNMFESMNNNIEDEYSNMLNEDIAKGYMEMGEIIAQENMEFNQNNK